MSRTLLLPALALAACTLDESGNPTNGTVVAEETSESNLAAECPASTPAALAPNADQTLAFVTDAQGVQKYTCVASTTGYTWTFVAPDADLFDSKAHGLAIHHFAGPTWLYKDSSSVLAAKKAGVTVDPTAIPWLLLDVKSHGGAADGKLSGINQIQRLVTGGGNAPAAGCDADHVGAESDVLYTARYFFYRTVTDETQVRCGG